MEESTSIWLFTGVIYGISCYAVYKVSIWLSPRMSKRYCGLSRRDRKDWDSRWSSTYHAVAITLLSGYIILFSDIFDSKSNVQVLVMEKTAPLTNIALGLSLGYFAVDLGMMLKYYPWMGGAEMVVHHLAALLSVVRALTQQKAHLYTLALLATEMTTPCINVRWLMDKADRKSSPVYTINGLMLVLLWLMGRILLFVPFFIHMYHHRHELQVLKGTDAALIIGVPTLLLGLNTFWFSKIVKGAMKVIKSAKGKKAMAVEKDGLAVGSGTSEPQTVNGMTNGMLRHRATAAVR